MTSRILVTTYQIARRFNFKLHYFLLRHQTLKAAVILLTVLLAIMLVSTQEYNTLKALGGELIK